MSRWLVTGGAGFIGSHIVESLVASGQFVRVLDDLSTGSVKNIEPLLGQIEFIRGDIRDSAITRQSCQGIDFVLHLAAQGSVPRSIEDPERAMDVNINGTLCVLQAARTAKVRRVVLSSSSSVYGKQASDYQVETLATRPASPYALSKLATEHWGRLFSELYQLETVSLRYFNVFGPRQDPHSQYSAVIPLFISRLLQGELVEIHGDGRQSRDFTYVDNVVAANIVAATSSVPAGDVFNIACGQTTSINDLYKIVQELLGVEQEPRFLPRRSGDIDHSRASIEKATSILGWVPEITFVEGLRRSVEWYKENNQLVQLSDELTRRN